MKPLVIILTIILPSMANAQLSELSISIGPSVSFVPERSDRSGVLLEDPNTPGAVIGISREVTERYEPAFGASGGFAFRYRLSENWFLASGITGSLLRFRYVVKSHTTSTWTMGESYQYSENYYNSNVGDLGKTSLWMVQIPVMAGLSVPASNKFSLAFGVAVNKVIAARMHQFYYDYSSLNTFQMYPTNGPLQFPPSYEDGKNADVRNQFNSVTLSALFQVHYQMTKAFRLGVDVQPYLTPIRRNDHRFTSGHLTSVNINASFAFANIR